MQEQCVARALRSWRMVFLLCATAGLAACNIIEGLGTDPVCSPDEVESCRCANGAQGTRTCWASGNDWDDCVCSGASDGGQIDTSPGQDRSGGSDSATGDDAGAPDAGADDAAGADAATMDAATTDARLEDAAASDALLPDTLLPDTLIPDTNLPDTLLPDTLLPDTNLPDTLLPDARTPCTVVCDFENGSVFDPLHRLVWKQCSQGQTHPTCAEDAGNYQYCSVENSSCNDDVSGRTLTEPLHGARSEAYETCERLNNSGLAGYDEHTDWRVPRIEELQDFYLDVWETSPTFYPNTPLYIYWSSTSSGIHADARAVDFSDGGLEYLNKTTELHVRCVRGPY